MIHTGRCLCGQVTLAIDAEPLGARMCWCRDCQSIASGSATVNLLFPVEAVRIDGDVGRFEKIADSGNRVERGFCRSCGAQIYARTSAPADAPMRIRAGILDDPELMPPQSAIWTDSAPSWVSFDPALPRHPKAPN